MVTHLFDLTTTTSPSSSTPSDPYTVGTRFGVTTGDTSCTGARWYRGSTTSGQKPSRLALYQAGTSAPVREITTGITDSGAVGWQTTNWSSAFTLVTGTTYVVAMDWPSGQTWYYLTRSAISAPPSGYLWDDDIRAWATPTYGNPSSHDNSLAWLVDIETGGSGGGSGGGGDAGVELPKWLSSDDTVNEHQSDGLPWLTYQQLLDGDTGLAAIASAIGAVMGSGWNSATDTLHAIRTAITTINSTINTVAANVATQLERWSQDLADTLEGAAQFLAHPDRGPLGALTNTTPVPGTGWALVGEADFDDCDVITVQAHLIVVDFAEFPVEIRQHNVCGVPIRYRLGWWCPANGEFMGERRFIDFEKMHLQDNGRLMNGALLVCKPGTSGHWQAWLLS